MATNRLKSQTKLKRRNISGIHIPYNGLIKATPISRTHRPRHRNFKPNPQKVYSTNCAYTRNSYTTKMRFNIFLDTKEI